MTQPPASEPPRRTVAFLISGIDAYGVRRGTLGLMDELRDRGHRVFAIAFVDGEMVEDVKKAGFDVEMLGRGLPPPLIGSVPGKLFAAFRLWRYAARVAPRIADILRARNADALHVRWPNLVPVGARGAHSVGLPTLWHMPNIVSDRFPLGINRRLWQYTCRSRNVTPLANSRFTASTLDGRGVSSEILYVPISERRFDPDAVTPVSRAEVGIPDDAIVAGVFSRLDSSKGQDRLVEALAIVRDEIPDLHLFILGSAPREPEFLDHLNERIETLGLADRVHLQPFVDDPERYYGFLDFSVNSRVDPEPFGLSVTESMAMRVPVLVHALGGPAETVIDGRTGWHIHDPSAESFAGGLRRAVADRPRWPEMGEAAREHSLSSFTMRALVEVYERILERAIAASRAGQAGAAPLDASH